MMLRNYLTTGQGMPNLQAKDTAETRHGQWPSDIQLEPQSEGASK